MARRRNPDDLPCDEWIPCHGVMFNSDGTVSIMSEGEAVHNPVDHYGLEYPEIPDIPRPLNKKYGPHWMDRPDARELQAEFNRQMYERQKALKAYKKYVEESNRLFYERQAKAR